MGKKVRLDQLLVERGEAASLEAARALVMAGQVVVDDHAAAKAGELVRHDAVIRLKGEFNPYVSRGGLKLEAGLEGFGVDPGDLVCVDIGASTGGFTDCLLQRRARLVYAVDVGYGQLAWKLREDSRVICMERMNVRNMDAALVVGGADLVVADASFISLALILPKVYELLKSGGKAIVLAKPQFEVERGQVDKGGVVNDPAARLAALEKVCLAAIETGFTVAGRMESPVPGAKKGNIEYLVHLEKE